MEDFLKKYPMSNKECPREYPMSNKECPMSRWVEALGILGYKSSGEGWSVELSTRYRGKI
jgi:hypothetical protein